MRKAISESPTRRSRQERGLRRVHRLTPRTSPHRDGSEIPRPEKCPRARLRLARVRAPLPRSRADSHGRGPAPRGRGHRAVSDEIRPHEVFGFQRPAEIPRDPPAPPDPQESNQRCCARSLTRDGKSHPRRSPEQALGHRRPRSAGDRFDEGAAPAAWLHRRSGSGPAAWAAPARRVRRPDSATGDRQVADPSRGRIDHISVV